MSHSKHRKKRKHGLPDPPQHLAVNATPATEEDTVRAIRAFIERFVSPERRGRALLFLVPPRKRHEHLRDAFGRVDPALCSELGRSSGFPQHLAKKFGHVRGILITPDQDAVHLSMPEAADSSDSIFISDDHTIAVLFYDVGSPTLCAVKPGPVQPGAV